MMITVVKPQSLTSRQQYLGTIAALEALGDMERLNSALKNALDGELTINEIKEVFSHLYAYTGFPRSLNALNELKKCFSQIVMPNGRKVSYGCVHWYGKMRSKPMN